MEQLICIAEPVSAFSAGTYISCESLLRFHQHDLQQLVLEDPNAYRRLLQFRLDALDGSLDAHYRRGVTDIAASLIQFILLVF